MTAVTTPSEVVQIAPENLIIANTYLEYQTIEKTAQELDIPAEMVCNVLEKREIKAYIDRIFFNIGFNNRFKLRDLMDTIIQKKLKDMDEADVGSSKDIADLLALSHKMTMEHLNKEIELEKLRKGDIRSQVNVQINDTGGSNYENLIKKLIEPEK